MRVKALIVCIALTMSFSACDLLTAKYVDVSEETGIREIVSTSRRTKIDLLLLGVDFYPSKHRIESYRLVPPPGFDGPEVLSRSRLPQGTILHFTGAKRCENCAPKNVLLSATVDGFVQERPVYIDMAFIDLLE